MLGLRGRRPHPAAAMASIDNDLPGVSIEVPPPVPSARGVGASLSSRCNHLCLAIPIQGPKELRGTAAPKIPLNVNIDVENTSSITVVYRSWVLEIWPNVTTWVMSGARGDLYLGQPVYGCVEQDYEGLCDEANARNCFPQFVTLVDANQRRGHDSTARIINAMPRPTVDVTPKTTASSHLQKDQEGRIARSIPRAVGRSTNFYSILEEGEEPNKEALTKLNPHAKAFKPIVKASLSLRATASEYIPEAAGRASSQQKSSTAEQQSSHAVSDETPTTTVGAAGHTVPQPSSRARRSQHKSSQVGSQDVSASALKPTTAPGAAGHVKRVTEQKSSTAEQQSLPHQTRQQQQGKVAETAPIPTSPIPQEEKAEPTSFRDFIERDARLLKELGLAELVRRRRETSDFASLENVDHPAYDLLRYYKRHGAPVKFSNDPWTKERIDSALQRGAHRSCFEHLDFLEEEFIDMIRKGQWIVLPAKDLSNTPFLRLSPPGVVPQLGRRPRWIVDYTWSGVNDDTLSLAPKEAMQFGHALDRILREILLADPRHGPVRLLKADLSDGFYRVHLNINDIAKLGVVFPTRPGAEQLVALPLVLPMGWKNSPPIFSALTETIADLANWRLAHSYPSPPHHLDDEAESIVPDNPLTGLPTIQEESDGEPHPLDEAAHAVPCPPQASRDREMTKTTTVGAAGDAVPEPNSRARRFQQKSSQVDSQGCSESDPEPTTATGAAGRVQRVPEQRSSTAEQQPVDCSASDPKPTTATGAAGRVQRVPKQRSSTAEQQSSSPLSSLQSPGAAGRVSRVPQQKSSTAEQRPDLEVDSQSTIQEESDGPSLDDAAHVFECPLQARRDREMDCRASDPTPTTAIGVAGRVSRVPERKPSTAEQQPSHATSDDQPTTTVGAAGYAVPEPNSRARRSQQKSSQVDSQDCSASDLEPTTATGAAGRVKRVPEQKSSTAEQQPVDCSASDLEPTTATGAAGRVERVPKQKSSTAEQQSSSHQTPHHPPRAQFYPSIPAPNAKCHQSLPIPVDRDPSLPFQSRPLSYVDIFVDDFIGLAQDLTNERRVRRILLHAIDDVIRPLQKSDGPYRREPVSLKKLRQGDCSWSTVKQILGWVIDTVSMTIHLPPHRLERLGEILASIPATQKRTSVKKWHKVLGELRSMSLALPGARNLFSHMQHALSSKLKGRVALTKGVHDALDDFRWILNDIASRPTRIAELVPLLASAEGHHDASGKGAGGIWFPADQLNPRHGYSQKPVVWRFEWPQHIIDKLVTTENPNGTISNSDLELAGGLIHLEALAQTFDVRERTLLSKTDNLNTLFWQRKGSATTEKVPAHLLRLFGIHQRHHRYVSRHDYLPGESNPVADGLSRDFTLSWKEQMAKLAPYLPNPEEYQVWTPSEQFMESILSALVKKRVNPQSLFIEPPKTANYEPTPPTHTQLPTVDWPSAPYTKPSRAKFEPYKSSGDEFQRENLQPSKIPSSLGRLKVTYGAVPRRPSTWGPKPRADNRSSKRRPQHAYSMKRQQHATAVSDSRAFGHRA